MQQFPPLVEFTIEMTEFAFTPETLEVQLGQEVTLHLVNQGTLDHELMIGRQIMMMDGAPNNYAHNLFEWEAPMVLGEEGDAHSMNDRGMDHGFMVLVPARGEEATITFTPTEDMVGEWEIGCFTDGGPHYIQGRKGKFLVNP